MRLAELEGLGGIGLIQVSCAHPATIRQSTTYEKRKDWCGHPVAAAATRNRLHLIACALLTFLEYAAIVVGAIAIFVGRHYALANGVHLGILLIGVGLAVGGIESLYTRRMSLRFSEDAAEGYSGFPALVWGTMLLLRARRSSVTSSWSMASGQKRRTF